MQIERGGRILLKCNCKDKDFVLSLISVCLLQEQLFSSGVQGFCLVKCLCFKAALINIVAVIDSMTVCRVTGVTKPSRIIAGSALPLGSVRL